MVLGCLDPNDPQPKRADYGYDYDSFRRDDKAWNKREGKRRKLAGGKGDSGTLVETFVLTVCCWYVGLCLCRHLYMHRSLSPIQTGFAC